MLPGCVNPPALFDHLNILQMVHSVHDVMLIIPAEQKVADILMPQKDTCAPEWDKAQEDLGAWHIDNVSRGPMLWASWEIHSKVKDNITSHL